MPRIFTRHPNPPPPKQQNKRKRNKQQSQASQQSTSPPNAQIMKHRRRKKRKPGPKRRAQEIIPRQHRSRIPWIRMCKITKYTIKNQTTTKGEKHRRDDRHNPMHASKVACPAEPEERNGKSEGAYDGGRHLIFGCDVAFFIEVARLVAIFPVEVAWDGDAAG